MSTEDSLYLNGSSHLHFSTVVYSDIASLTARKHFRVISLNVVEVGMNEFLQKSRQITQVRVVCNEVIYKII